MVSSELPDFVQRGTFDWMRLGYHVSQNVRAADRSQRTQTQNDWFAIADVLEHAKAGDHSFVKNLASWFQASQSNAMDRVCILLTGDAGTNRDVASLVSLMESGADDVRAYAAKAAMGAGVLSLVPFMLQAWLAVSDGPNHEIIGHAISSMLEVGAGEISQHAGTFSLKRKDVPSNGAAVMNRLFDRFAQRDDDLAFRQIVEARYAEVLKLAGSDDVAVWQGEPINVRRFADAFLALIREDGGSPELLGTFVEWRQKFQTMTGVDCSNFFSDGRLQPLEAEVVLEAFLASDQPDRYVTGRRYFYGHLVPNDSGR